MPPPPKFWVDGPETPREEPPEYDEHPQIGTLRPKTQNFLEALPPQIRPRVDRLLGLQAAQRQLQREYRLDLLALEKRHLAKAKPLFDERAQLVSEPVLHAGDNAFPGPAVGVPAFWLMAMRKHPVLCDLIEECDVEALAYLIDIHLETLPSPELGFRLLFEFAKNPFFENKILQKMYTYQGGDDGSPGLYYDQVIGDEIFWMKGQELPPSGLDGLGEPSTPPPRSFFDFFRPPKATPDSPDGRDIVEAQLVLDYGYGEFFKDELIPNCVDWFTGEAEDDPADDNQAPSSGVDDRTGDWIWSPEHGRYYRYAGDNEQGAPIYIWDEST
ncbi:hypothetical protein BJX76DRAFT_362968 [Aspergillus varians]